MLKLQLQLELSGGATSTVFPKVESWIDADSDRMRALEFVASRKNMGRYRSVMDFLFCEIFTDQKKACFKFYADKGPQLIELATPAEIAVWERKLMIAVRHAYTTWCEKRVISWSIFREESLRYAA